MTAAPKDAAETPPPPAPTPAPRRSRRVPLVVTAAVAAVLALGGLLRWRATASTNRVALTATPRGATVVKAQAATWRAERRYVGTVQPWLEARVGPQLVSGYVASVLVRPGDVVRRGDVVATLDCRNTSASTETVQQQARSLEERQRAIASESARLAQLKDGGYISENELDQKVSQAASGAASLEALRAQLRGKDLEVSDCTLRAPFDGEVAQRFADPGGFVRPGAPIVTVIDRHLVRVVADAPEVDFALLQPGTPVQVTLLATGQHLTAAINRRAPAAAEATRTLRFEVDLHDLGVPVATTAEVRLSVGAPQESVEVPLLAARVRGDKATLFVVRNDVAHRVQVAVLGERDDSLFVEPALPPGALVVTEGRGLLTEGDPVVTRLDVTWPRVAPPDAGPAKVSGAGGAGHAEAQP